MALLENILFVLATASLVLGGYQSSGNQYGAPSNSYQGHDSYNPPPIPPIIEIPSTSYGTPEKVVPPPPAQPVETYNAPVHVEKPVSSYDVPIVPPEPVKSYGAPSRPVEAYSAPSKPSHSYGTPAKPSHSYGAPSRPSYSYGVSSKPAAHTYGSPILRLIRPIHLTLRTFVPRVVITKTVSHHHSRPSWHPHKTYGHYK